MMSDEREILAAEYVLGTLHADERTLFASALANDSEARASVAAWENRLAPLSLAVEEIPPPPAVWRRIEEALPSGAPFGLAGGDVARGADDDGETAGSIVVSLRRSLARWRTAAIAAGALAAGLGALAISRELVRQPSVQPSYVAVVNRGGDLPALVVRVDLKDGAVYVRPVATQTPAGKSLELWYIGDGKAPKSMGVLGADPSKIPLPAGLSLQKAVFAVTVEPTGGSPTGGPTGPIVYSGQLIKE